MPDINCSSAISRKGGERRYAPFQNLLRKVFLESYNYRLKQKQREETGGKNLQQGNRRNWPLLERGGGRDWRWGRRKLDEATGRGPEAGTLDDGQGNWGRELAKNNWWKKTGRTKLEEGTDRGTGGGDLGQ